MVRNAGKMVCVARKKTYLSQSHPSPPPQTIGRNTNATLSKIRRIEKINERSNGIIDDSCRVNYYYQYIPHNDFPLIKGKLNRNKYTYDYQATTYRKTMAQSSVIIRKSLILCTIPLIRESYGE